MNNEIRIEQAIQIHEQVSKEQIQEQVRLTDEFLTSSHCMLDTRDLLYYADATGKGMQWIRDNYKPDPDNDVSGRSTILGQMLHMSEVDDDDLIAMGF